MKQAYQMPEPNVLLCDIGGVTVFFRGGDRERALARLSGKSFEEVEKIVRFSPEFEELERGKMSFDAFFDHCRQRLGGAALDTMRLEDFSALWAAPIVGCFERPAALFRKLGSRLLVASASNISEHDLLATERRMPQAIAHLAKDTHSFRLGRRKGDPDYFEVLLKTLKAWPEECLFLDDRAENVVAARKNLIPAILVQGDGESVDYERLVSDLLGAGIPAHWVF